MAGEDGDEVGIERQLEQQLEEQRASIAAVDEALAADPANAELLAMCKFFLQQRCWFGSNCRSSHGFVVPTSSLKEYIPTLWHHSLVGTNVLAASGNHSGIWRKAELELWDDEHKLGQVVFLHDGSSANLGSNSLSISEYAEITDDDEEDSSFSERSECSEEEENNQGVGFLEATTLQRGIQTETAVFAKWEHHTRGIASKIMASMGYRKGMGLGVSGQGMVDPVPVKVLPPKQSLDHAVASKENKVGRAASKKPSRGGKRKREKKYAALARAAKAKEGQKPDVFSFINKQLYGPEEKKRSGEGDKQPKHEDRISLVAYGDEVKELRSRVEKLEEMVKRNHGKDKAVYGAASRKLGETRKALADAEATHASASTAVVGKEKEKKWLKF